MSSPDLSHGRSSPGDPERDQALVHQFIRLHGRRPTESELAGLGPGSVTGLRPVADGRPRRGLAALLRRRRRR